MCGIVGYIGYRQATQVLLEGLERLEYRGYDSAGIAIPQGADISIHRAAGKLQALKDQLATKELEGTIGVGHTRWATHGLPTEYNAHPHRAGDIVLVHNGILENYQELRAWLEKEGCQFLSDTDTEVFCHLLQFYYQKSRSMEEAFHKGLKSSITCQVGCLV